MYLLIPILLYGYGVIAAVLLTVMPARRAIIVALLLGSMFLPEWVVDSSFVAFNKLTAISLGVLGGALLVTPGRVLAYRPKWVDAPAIVWCLIPLLSGLANGETFYDSAAAAATQTCGYAVPYFLGRIFIRDFKAVRELAVAVFAAGVVYAPLCLYEVRFSPQLHVLAYGVRQHDWFQSLRWGGYRPMVFMQHGLAVAMFMSVSALVGAWLGSTGALKKLWGVPTWLLAAGLGVTEVLCKSAGAVALMAVGFAALYVGKWARVRLLLAAMLLAPPAYFVVRIVLGWSGESAVALVQSLVSDDRAGSLNVRLKSEQVLVERAMVKPLWGWGAEHVMPRDEFGNQTVVCDSQWIIALSGCGLIGLAALFAAWLGPVVLLLRAYPRRVWSHPVFAPAGALAVVLAVYALDSLMNAMVNPLYMLSAGGLANLSILAAKQRRIRKVQKQLARAARPARAPAYELGRPQEPRGLANEDVRGTPWDDIAGEMVAMEGE